MPKNKRRFAAVLLGVLCLGLIFLNGLKGKTVKLLSPFGSSLAPLEEVKGGREVFGFAPYWTINKLDNVDFNTLTTLAYFDVPVKANGHLDKDSQGYKTFKGKQATKVFRKAHAHGTRVVLTLTQMDNASIKKLMDNPEAQKIAIAQAVEEVDKRGIDGINVDFEYIGHPGEGYRRKFTKFVSALSREMHKKNPGSQVTVSVYASAVKEPKIYDIHNLAKVSDGIFMMAYDFATKKADQAMPTAPLYGHKEGLYWYDIATAVEDFTKVMPSHKLILGVPWYGYDYPVYEPTVKADVHKGSVYWYKKWSNRWRWSWRKGTSRLPSLVQTYERAQDNIKGGAPGITDYKEGWDDSGKVGWKAYKNGSNTWRMVFIEDERSLGIKYDFAKDNNLGGVGIWALGFDHGQTEMWGLLRDKFGVKLADYSLLRKAIAEEYD